MTKLLNNKYLMYALLCLLLVGIVLTFSVRSMETANADYQDIINDNTALVNFNQYIQETYINYTTSSYYANTLPVGQYYMRINSNVDTRILFVYTGGAYYQKAITTGQNDFIINFNNQINAIQFDNAITYTNFNAINLTQMFGVENIPSLSECLDLFVADSYPYNTGSPVSLSGLNSYAQGYNDASSSYTTITTSYDSYAQIFDAGASYFVKHGDSNGTSFTGRVGFYLGFTAQAGTSLDISLNYFLVHNTADLQIGYVANGSFVPLFSGIRDVWTPHSSGLGYTAQIHLTLPVATSYLYLYSYVASVSDNPACILGSYEITYTAYDYQNAVIDAEKNGYSRAENLYKPQLESYTNENGTGYQNIYNNGYQDGLNAQVSEARKKTYTFTNFLGALFDVPVTTLKSLLDFNFLGFNLKNFVFSILTLSIVFAIIKLILVKSGDGK